MWAVFSKEFNGFFNSLVGYLVVAVFLTGLGLLVWIFPDNVLEGGFASLDILFGTAPFVFLFLVPAITMRSLAEEKKAGTMELLLTRPLTDLQIIGGKYLACVALVAMALLPTLVYYGSVYALGSPAGNLDSAGVAGSYLGLVLLGAGFAAIGVFASSLTESQIVAFILAVFLSFLFYAGFSSVAQLEAWSGYALAIAQWGMDYHYNSLGRGLIDSRDVLYFFSLIVLFLYGTWLVLRSRQWG
ncbi:MAG: gliding motility-associated ABC transporter permease subunit GldF [Bernardetiaceae bacterium]|jgi:ABC-2 type transport system permease protein|nr:gliding motility-associated ABC transporter permease subunit GldF [Bernardetiaceae bacterium]